MLGVLITVVTALFDRYQMLHRPRIYRVMRRRSVTGDSPRRAQKGSAVGVLGGQLVVALRDVEDHYITQIATEGSPSKEPHDDSRVSSEAPGPDQQEPQ